MSRKRILLVGAGGHVRSCIDVIEQTGNYDIHGLVGLEEEIGQSVLGYPVLCDDSGMSGLKPDCEMAVVTAGQIESPELRIRLFEHLKSLGFQAPAIVSPFAHVSRHATIGEGTIVMHGAIVNAGAAIGRNCIVNTKALVEHDAAVGDHCHVSTGAIINGGCHIGSGTFVGSGAVIREGIVLGARCLVGMGVAVRRSLGDDTRCTKPQS